MHSKQTALFNILMQEQSNVTLQ